MNGTPVYLRAKGAGDATFASDLRRDQNKAAVLNPVKEKN
jgi:hypothetical protein